MPGRGGDRAGGLDPQSDRWLVDKVRGGDVQAYEVLVRRHRDRIYRIARNMLGDPHDAEDVAQEVAIQLWSAVAGFAGASTFTTWLYRIVINRCLNHRRRKHRTRPITDADHPVVAGPEDAVLSQERAQAALAAMAKLPDELRTVLVLHQLEGLSYREVAAILNVTEPTVRGRLYRARRTLLADMRDWS